MSSEEIRLGITSGEPTGRTHKWYILIYSIKEGNETKDEMISALSDVPFIIFGSDKFKWLENVEFLIVPDEGFHRITDVLEMSSVSRIAPMQVSIETVSSNRKVSMMDDFYERKDLHEVEADIENNLTSLESVMVERKVAIEELLEIESKIVGFKGDINCVEEYDCTEYKRYSRAKSKQAREFWDRYCAITTKMSKGIPKETTP